MFGLGVPEIIVIGIIILLIFGAKRLPSIGEGLGKTVKELLIFQKLCASHHLKGSDSPGESVESRLQNPAAAIE